MITNFDKVSVGNRSGFGITVNVQNDNSAESGTFADALKAEKPSTVKVPCAPPDIAPDVEVPEQWSTENLFGYNAPILKNVLNYLNNELGVDTSKRTPTHTITDEQREWLASRHDLEALNNSTGETSELMQLFGDLVFLNVMSVSDVCNTMVPQPPLPEGQKGMIIWGDQDNFPDDTDLLLERIKKYIEMHRHLFELNKSEWSIDYLNEYFDFMESLEECHEVLSDLFRPVAKEDKDSELIGNRNVTDASEQLKADFGALLA